MLGRIPPRYRFTVWFAGLLSFAGAGAWLALVTGVPVVWSGGALIGVVLGVLATLAFLYSLEHEPTVRRRRTP